MKKFKQKLEFCQKNLGWASELCEAMTQEKTFAFTVDVSWNL